MIGIVKSFCIQHSIQKDWEYAFVKNRKPEYVHSRKIICYIASRMGFSYKAIGKMIGLDRTTVYHHVQDVVNFTTVPGYPRRQEFVNVVSICDTILSAESIIRRDISFHESQIAIHQRQIGILQAKLAVNGGT
jgi:hypothetical protein